ncbi:MAG: putative assembly protein, partial [Verrucomicrobiales bacterium]|nr:putative assembly protein [Verrucomicrobiales bacterium]
RVGKSMNSDLKVETLSLSPFSEVHLTGLKLQPNGKEPLLTAAEAHVRYNLMDIIRGTIRVDEVTLVSPVIELIKNPDGTSNLDPITQGSSKEKKASEPKKLQLAIKNISLKNGTVRITEKLKDGGTKTTELGNLNVTLDQLVTGAPGKLTLDSDLSMAASPKNGTNDLVKGNLKGAFEIALDPALNPQRLNGSAALKLGQTAGAYADYAGFGLVLDADVSPTEIRQAVVHFSKADQGLGELRVSGRFDPKTMEGHITQVFSVDKRLLNIAGGPRGIDFGNSSISSTNVIDLSKNGSLIGVAGKLSGRTISLAKQTQQTPALNLDADYQISVNRTDSSATIQKLNFTATQDGQPLLRTLLNQPMNVSWGGTVPGFNESALQVVLTNFNLGQWASVIGSNAPTGVVSATVDLLAQKGGQALTTTVAAQVNNLSLSLGTNAIRNADVALNASGTVENLSTINISKYSATIRENKGTLLQADGSVRYDLKTKAVSGQANAVASLATALELFPVAQFSVSSGEAKVTANFSMDNGKTAANGNLALQNLTGKYAQYVLDKFQAALEYKIDMTTNQVQIQTATLTFGQGATQGGTVDLKGSYDLTKKSANLEFKTVDLNQNTLTTFLAPSLGENKLVSISLNSNGSVGYDPNGETSIKTDLSIDKWVVQDAAKKLPAEPLSVKLQLDAGLNKQIVELRQLLLKLSPTERAKNELSIKGHIDSSKTNATPGTITIQSDSLDITHYYDLFAGKAGAATNATSGARQPTAATASIPPVKDPNKEPDPIALPFQDFTANLNIGQFYLRQIAASNLTLVAKINKGEVHLNPVKLSLNGAPLSADVLLNLGVPGYTYDLSFQADRVPLEPIVNSLSTNSTGQMKGLLVANAKIKGAGTTGVNLQKNLAGTANFSLTNMNVQVIAPKWRNVLEPIALVLNLPELTATPLDWLGGQVDVGAGKINLQQFTVVSPAFMANSQGTIPIEPILTNSPLNLPLSLSISRGLAQKARVPIPDTSNNTNYVKLPDFVTINGTLGKPGSKINKLAIVGIIAQSAGLTGKALNALPPGAGNLLQNVLGTGSATPPAANATNAVPATNSAPANLLRGLSNILNTQKTNAPA